MFDVFIMLFGYLINFGLVEVFCELSLCNYLVWMLGYVEFDWSALEPCDFKIDPKLVLVKTKTLDSLTIGSP